MKTRPSKGEYGLEGEAWAARPPAPRPGLRVPPPPGWEHYLLDLVSYVADLLEQQSSHKTNS